MGRLKLEDEEGPIGDIKFNGYILLAPSTAQSGRRNQPGMYKVISDLAPVAAPIWLSKTNKLSKVSSKASRKLSDLAHRVRETRRHENDDKLLKLLRTKRNTIKSREDWLKLGFAVHAGYFGTRWENEAYVAWIDFSDRWEMPRGTKEADFIENASRVWESASASIPNGVMPATAQFILGKLPDLKPSDLKPVIPKRSIVEETANPASIRLTGLAGAIAEVMRRASDRELEVFPEAAALIAMSALAAPCYVIRGPQGKTTLNIYALLLGGTGSGKEAARKATDMVLKASGRRNELLDGVASNVALHRALTEGGEITGTNRGSRGARVIAVDEGGLHLSAIRKGNNSHQQLLLAFMMRLFGLGLGRVSPHKYAEKSNEIPEVQMPRLTSIWTSTPAAFEQATGTEDSESGQLNRFLVLKEDGLPPLRDGLVERDLLDNPPNSIAVAAMKFPARTIQAHIAGALANEPTDNVIEMTDEAKMALESFRKGEVEDWRKRGGQEGESWARAAEYALRLSGLLALSDAAFSDEEKLTDVVCKVRHVELSIDLVRRALGGVVELAKNAGLSQTEQLKNKIKEVIITLAGEDGYAKASAVSKKVLRGVNSATRTSVLEGMLEDEEIITETRKTKGRPGIYYAVAENKCD